MPETLTIPPATSELSPEVFISEDVIRLALPGDAGEQFIQDERTIRTGLRTFFEVGNALLRIRDNRWYTAKGSQTFEAYCAAEWNISQSQAYRFIDAAQVVADLTSSPIGDTEGEPLPLPKNESQTRPIARLDAADLRTEAWKNANDKAAQEGRPITARHVEAAVQEIEAREKGTATGTGKPGASSASASAPAIAPLAVSVPVPSTYPGKPQEGSGSDLLTLTDVTPAPLVWEGPIYRLRYHTRDAHGNVRTFFSEIRQEGDGTPQTPFIYSPVLNGQTLPQEGSMVLARKRVEDKITEEVRGS